MTVHSEPLISLEVVWGHAGRALMRPCYQSEGQPHLSIWQVLAGRLSCSDRNSKTRIELATGDVYLLSACKPATLRQLDYTEGKRAFVRGADLRITLWGRIELPVLLDLPLVVPRPASDLLMESVNSLREAWYHRSQSIERLIRYQAAKGAVLHHLLSLGTPTAQARHFEKMEQRLHPALAKMQSDPHRLIPLGEMAAASGLSESRFKTLFRATFGCSPVRFHRELRLNEGARLLRDTTHTVDEIGCATGFSSGFHFSREFRNYFGRSPKEYRQSWNAAGE